MKPTLRSNTRKPFRPLLVLSVVIAALCLTGGAHAAVDLVKRAQLNEALDKVQDAMSRRDMATAKRFLLEAEKKVQTHEDDMAVARAALLVSYLDSFWKVLGQHMDVLAAPSEIMIKGKPAAVVESSSGNLTLKAAGQMFRWTRETLPGGVVLALSEQAFTNKPESKVAVGAFLIVDARGDKEMGMKLWRDAKKAGLRDAALLLGEASFAAGNNGPVAGGSTPGGGGVAGGGNQPAGGSQPVLTPGDLRPAGIPIPSDFVKIAAARESIRGVLKPQFDDATTTFKQADLGRKLLELPGNSEKIRNNAVLHYVVLCEARDMGIQAADPEIVGKAIEAIDALFEIDVIHAKGETIRPMLDSAKTTKARTDIAYGALQLAIQAVESGHKDAAGIATAAHLAAQKTNNRMLMVQALEVKNRAAGP